MRTEVLVESQAATLAMSADEAAALSTAGRQTCIRQDGGANLTLPRIEA